MRKDSKRMLMLMLNASVWQYMPPKHIHVCTLTAANEMKTGEQRSDQACFEITMKLGRAKVKESK